MPRAYPYYHYLFYPISYVPATITHHLSHGVVICLVRIQLLLDELSKLCVPVKLGAIADGRVLSQRGTQRRDLLGTALEIHQATALLVGVKVELECVG